MIKVNDEREEEHVLTHMNLVIPQNKLPKVCYQKYGIGLQLTSTVGHTEPDNLVPSVDHAQTC